MAFTTELIRSDRDLHMVINAANDEKEALYIERFVKPWQQMMQMVTGHVPNGGDDPLAGARMWGWFMPDQLDSAPPELVTMEAANAWEIAASAMQTAASAFAPYADRIPFDHVEGWLLPTDPTRAQPEMRGFAGAIDWMQPRFVIQFHDPSPQMLPALPGGIIHEMNHLVRFKVFPWDMANTSVADYIIHEGVAEAFAAEHFGEDTLIYGTILSPDELATAREIIGANLDKSGFNVIRGYIFGDSMADQWGFEKTGVPTYGGYGVGYHVVKAYIEHTGKSATEATFIPAAEIIAQSRFFED